MRSLPEPMGGEDEMRRPGPESAALDIMLVDPEEPRLLAVLRDLERGGPLRCAQKLSGRAALAGFSRARFDVVICRQDLGDTDCWRWIRMARSGRFGYAATPILVLCTGVERAELEPMLDEHTALVVEGDALALESALRAAREGAKRLAILIVEDEELAALAAARALEKFYRVDIALDGRTALDLWHSQHHALVVLDLMLPGVSGDQVLAGLLAENPSQPVIVLTAHDAPEQHQDLMLAGATAFISKPVDLHALPELCARTLRECACLNNAQRLSARESSWTQLVGRVRAANYHVERGQAAYAGAHLRRAILENRAHEPTDDHWAQLLGEFDAE